MATPVQRLRWATELEEIDYSLAMSCLQHYVSPRDVIRRMLSDCSINSAINTAYEYGLIF